MISQQIGAVILPGVSTLCLQCAGVAALIGADNDE